MTTFLPETKFKVSLEVTETLWSLAETKFKVSLEVTETLWSLAEGA